MTVKTNLLSRDGLEKNLHLSPNLNSLEYVDFIAYLPVVLTNSLSSNFTRNFISEGFEQMLLMHCHHYEWIGIWLRNELFDNEIELPSYKPGNPPYHKYYADLVWNRLNLIKEVRYIDDGLKSIGSCFYISALMEFEDLAFNIVWHIKELGGKPISKRKHYDFIREQCKYIEKLHMDFQNSSKLPACKPHQNMFRSLYNRAANYAIKDKTGNFKDAVFTPYLKNEKRIAREMYKRPEFHTYIIDKGLFLKGDALKSLPRLK